MNFWQWANAHPFLTFFLILTAGEVMSNVAAAIGRRRQ